MVPILVYTTQYYFHLVAENTPFGLLFTRNVCVCVCVCEERERERERECVCCFPPQYGTCPIKVSMHKLLVNTHTHTHW